MDAREYIAQIGQRAKKVQSKVSALTTLQKNEALSAIADRLLAEQDAILQANQKDIDAVASNGISEVMVDRLRLTEVRIQGIAQAVVSMISLTDPVGIVDGGYTLPNGIALTKIRVPMGVVGIIYESRPNVTVDAAALCLKSSNVAVLRGGKEAIHTNIALANTMRSALKDCGLPEDMILLVEDTSRESATEMMRLYGVLDVLIPRGGAGLIQSVVQNAKVPVIETGTGNCHVYVDQSADLAMAVSIVDNAKTSRPSVCNACEGLLVHEAVAQQFLPMLKKVLDEHNVIWYGCEKTRQYTDASVLPATEESYATEYLDYKISVKVVASVEQAVEHIQTYGTGHSECIVTSDLQSANYFTQTVDAAAVYVNASTRYTDGGEFGLGAEIGISTQKLHTRGPMGLEALTTVKYVLQGNGQIRV